MKRRILSLILCLMMIVSLFPAVYAEEGDVVDQTTPEKVSQETAIAEDNQAAEETITEAVQPEEPAQTSEEAENNSADIEDATEDEFVSDAENSAEELNGEEEPPKDDDLAEQADETAEETESDILQSSEEKEDEASAGNEVTEKEEIPETEESLPTASAAAEAGENDADEQAPVGTEETIPEVEERTNDADEQAPVGTEETISKAEERMSDAENETPAENADPTEADDETRAKRVSVLFVCNPKDAVVTVYDPGILDENNEAIALEPEEDGSYLLLPGDYCYDAVCSGYKSAEKTAFTVELPEDDHIVVVDVILEEEVEEEEEPEEPYKLDIPMPEPRIIPDMTDDPADNDQLFSDYANSVLFPNSGNNQGKLKAKAQTIGSRFTGLDRQAYIILTSNISEVANGTMTSTNFFIAYPTLGVTDTVITPAECGVESFYYDSKDYDLIDDYLFETYTIERDGNEYVRLKLHDALRFDNPFEMYWYGNQSRFYPDFAYYSDGTIHLEGGYHFGLYVAKEYSATNEEKTFKTNGAGAIVQTAKQNAQNIISKHSGKSDYEKLYNYADEISALVEYNYDVLNVNVPYGNPWQLIWVFDGDPSTKVVCEGYAKAYQYLCDLSSFQNSLVRCISVGGHLNGGRHLYNVVRMDDGKNYLVDVTNIDNGSSANHGILFLAGATEGSIENGYTFNPGYTYKYYEDETIPCFARSDLEIASSDYDPSGMSGGESVAITVFPDVNFRAYLSENVDKNGDGRLSTGEIVATKSISCPNMGIATLRGIERFYMLEELDCSQNSLSSLDLSENKNLNTLRCQDNRLTSLDLGNNQKLEFLWCFGNQISAMDLSHNTLIYNLDCSYNTLTTLDLSMMSDLYSLSCEGNNLTQVYVHPDAPLQYCNKDDTVQVIRGRMITAISSVTPMSNALKITWEALDGIENYNLYRSTSASGNYSYLASVKGLSYTDTGVSSGTTYFYKVRPYKKIDGKVSYGEYSPAMGMTFRSLSLSASPKSGVTMTVSWTAVQGAKRYGLFVLNPQEDVFYEYKSLGGNQLSTSHTGLTAGTKYEYQLFAYDANDKEIASSNTAAAVALATPTLSTAKSGSEGVELTWTKASGADRYNIYRSTSANGTYSYIQSVQKVESYTDKTAADGVTYYYKIRAYKKYDGIVYYGGYSNSKGGTFHKAVELTAAPKSGVTITLSWKGPAGVYSYEIQHSTDGTNFATLKSTGANQTSTSHTGLTASTRHFYKVLAKDRNGNVMSVSPVKAAVALATPTITGATASGGNVTLTWSKASGADRYNVYRSDSQNGTYTYLQSVQHVESYTDTTAEAGKTYYYKVRAYKKYDGIVYYGGYSEYKAISVK